MFLTSMSIKELRIIPQINIIDKIDLFLYYTQKKSSFKLEGLKNL